MEAEFRSHGESEQLRDLSQTSFILCQTESPVNLTPFIQFLRQQWLPLVATVIGVVLGKSLHHTPQTAAPSKAPSAATAQSETSAHSGADLPDNTDSMVEAEVARLLGGLSPAAGTRTPQQSIDAISAAFSEKSDLRRFLAIYEAASELGKDDIAAALERARAEDNPIAIRALERRWAELDPVGAIKAWKDGNAQPLGDAFFTAWAKSNPASALRWFSSLDDGDFKTQARSLILDRVAKTDPQRALDFANQLPEGKDQTQLITSALATMVSKDPDVAMAAAKRLPEGVGRKAGIDAVVAQVASSNVEEAQRLVTELPPNTVSNAGAVIAVALVRQSADKALAWAGTLPEGQSKDAVYGGIAREWATRDVAAAATWLDTLPKGTARDSAVASFANRTAPRDPESASMWASTLPSGPQRTSTLSQTVGIWQRINPSAATEWVTNAPGLSADERTALSQISNAPVEQERTRPSRRSRAGN
jgi:hypothetical protein